MTTAQGVALFWAVIFLVYVECIRTGFALFCEILFNLGM